MLQADLLLYQPALIGPLSGKTSVSKLVWYSFQDYLM